MKIINIQGGTFTNTGIKTKALIIKKCNNDNYNQDIEFIELNQEVKVLGIRKLNEKIQFTFEDKKEEIINYNSEIEIKTLGEVCEFQNGYSFKSTDYEKQNDTNIGIVQIKSIQNGFIDSEKITEYIKEDKKYKSFEIQKRDILIALSGATIGKIGIYNLQQKSYLNQRVAKINAINGINHKYIYYWYICNKNHEFFIKAAIKKKVKDKDIDMCSRCSGRIPSAEQNFEIQHPEIAKEWDYKKNKSLPNEYTRGSKYKAWWICKKDHSYKMPINSRTSTFQGCSKCRPNISRAQIRIYAEVKSIFPKTKLKKIINKI
jgi:hypothetical protein